MPSRSMIMEFFGDWEFFGRLGRAEEAEHLAEI